MGVGHMTEEEIKKLVHDMTIVFDVETSNGLIKKNESYDKQTVQLVQLAYKVMDDDRVVRASSCLIRQSVPICEQSKLVHGITDEMCSTYGRLIETVFDEFNYWYNKSHYVIGYNVGFDIQVMNIVAQRLNKSFDLSKDVIDIVDLARDFCQLSLTEKQIRYGITGFRKPKLSVAYNMITGKIFDGAHDAMNDVDATIEIMKRLYEFKNL